MIQSTLEAIQSVTIVFQVSQRALVKDTKHQWETESLASLFIAVPPPRKHAED